MGRFLDLVLVLAAIGQLMVIQMAGAVILDPLRDDMIEDGIDSKYDAQAQFDQSFTVVTKWGPWILAAGTIVLVGFREYRRQRLVATRRLGPP